MENLLSQTMKSRLSELVLTGETLRAAAVGAQDRHELARQRYAAAEVPLSALREAEEAHLTAMKDEEAHLAAVRELEVALAAAQSVDRQRELEAHLAAVQEQVRGMERTAALRMAAAELEVIGATRAFQEAVRDAEAMRVKARPEALELAALRGLVSSEALSPLEKMNRDDAIWSAWSLRTTDGVSVPRPLIGGHLNLADDLFDHEQRWRSVDDRL